MEQAGTAENHLCVNLGFKMFVNTVSHPFEYAKVLIQIGHEPLPPYLTRGFITNRPCLGLPNVIEYIKYIKQVNGFYGMYSGLFPRIISNSIHAVTCLKVSDAARKYIKIQPCDKAKKLKEEEIKSLNFYKGTLINLCGKVAAVVASQPFQVIMIRTMAQFVGGETKYCGMFSAISEIYANDGLLGFFHGLIPRLLGEILSVILVNVGIYLARHTFTVEDDMMIGLPIAIGVSTLTYPFYTVSTCMAVVDSGLTAGYPPHMPLYKNWLDCWAHLSHTNELNRGSGMFFRIYRGPVSWDGGKLIIKKTL